MKDNIISGLTPGDKRELTGNLLPRLDSPRLVSARCLAYGFVGGGQGDDGEEGEDEAGGAADVPPSEDDAEVLRGPGEEHLYFNTLRNYTSYWIYSGNLRNANALHSSSTYVLVRPCPYHCGPSCCDPCANDPSSRMVQTGIEYNWRSG